ncbi:UNVERIFIED_CONTAM: hypothetical protein Sangu_1756900 [Sesamum angustifolium]|uniref:Uncharacterized protein n=1 Tax=Sesamum angustifolium TaxID=2727405 RepID=A0AAW2M5P4_9LAMI
MKGVKGVLIRLMGRTIQAFMKKRSLIFYGDDEFRTIITDKWESFDDDFMYKNPFGSPFLTYVQGSKHQEVPDMISFL